MVTCAHASSNELVGDRQSCLSIPRFRTRRPDRQDCLSPAVRQLLTGAPSAVNPARDDGSGGLDDAFDVDDRREAGAFRPERLQAEEHALVERRDVGDDHVIRLAGDRVDRLAKRAQCALIRELNRDDYSDTDGDAEDGEGGAELLAEDGAEDEGFEN